LDVNPPGVSLRDSSFVYFEVFKAAVLFFCKAVCDQSHYLRFSFLSRFDLGQHDKSGTRSYLVISA